MEIPDRDDDLSFFTKKYLKSYSDMTTRAHHLPTLAPSQTMLAPSSGTPSATAAKRRKPLVNFLDSGRLITEFFVNVFVILDPKDNQACRDQVSEGLPARYPVRLCICTNPSRWEKLSEIDREQHHMAPYKRPRNGMAVND